MKYPRTIVLFPGVTVWAHSHAEHQRRLREEMHTIAWLAVLAAVTVFIGWWFV